MSSYIDTDEGSLVAYLMYGLELFDLKTLKDVLLKDTITKVKIYKDGKTKIFVALEDETNKITGEWKDIYDGFGTCSICDYRNVVDNYCPNCGAKMKERH